MITKIINTKCMESSESYIINKSKQQLRDNLMENQIQRERSNSYTRFPKTEMNLFCSNSLREKYYDIIKSYDNSFAVLESNSKKISQDAQFYTRYALKLIYLIQHKVEDLFELFEKNKPLFNPKNFEINHYELFTIQLKIIDAIRSKDKLKQSIDTLINQFEAVRSEYIASNNSENPCFIQVGKMSFFNVQLLQLLKRNSFTCADIINGIKEGIKLIKFSEGLSITQEDINKIWTMTERLVIDGILYSSKMYPLPHETENFVKLVIPKERMGLPLSKETLEKIETTYNSQI